MKTILLILIVLLSGKAINYGNSIHNPDNIEFVQEIAFNEGIKVEYVTQEMFNERYLKN